MALEGSVARIVSEHELVINRGAADGVREGQRFVVFVALDEVTDPETGSSLGNLEIVKARLVALHVQERMTVCGPSRDTTASSEEDPTQRTLSAEMVAVSMSSSRRPGPTLNVDRSSMTGVPRVGPIAVGDRVRAID
jgi:hypothetical protein